MLMVVAPWKVQGVSRNWPSAIHLARQIINSHPKKMTVSSASPSGLFGIGNNIVINHGAICKTYPHPPVGCQAIGQQ
jgi:hypothetical protein